MGLWWHPLPSAGVSGTLAVGRPLSVKFTGPTPQRREAMKSLHDHVLNSLEKYLLRWAAIALLALAIYKVLKIEFQSLP